MNPKFCKRCGQWRTEEDFYRSTRNKSGFASQCKKCERAKPSAQRKTLPVLFNSTEKQCSRCREVKPHSDFYRRKGSPTGLHCYCKSCQLAATGASSKKHIERRRARERQRLESCPATHMKYRILGLVRKAIDRHALDYPVSSVTREFWLAVGYTRQELAEHLEALFLPGMSWENRREWHIDHIIPVSYFKPTSFSDPKFLACWGLNNLRPMWAADNLRKRASLEFLHLVE
jgi:hypothetical protein